MAISDLRKIKKEWLKNTVTSSYLKRAFKLSEEEINQIKSEVRYGKERYNIQEAKWYIDSKINKQSSVKLLAKANTKICIHCKKNVNKDFFSNTKTGICIKCERKIKNQTNRKLEKVNESRKIKASRDQIPLL